MSAFGILLVLFGLQLGYHIAEEISNTFPEQQLESIMSVLLTTMLQRRISPLLSFPFPKSRSKDSLIYGENNDHSHTASNDSGDDVKQEVWNTKVGG